MGVQRVNFVYDPRHPLGLTFEPPWSQDAFLAVKSRLNTLAHDLQLMQSIGSFAGSGLRVTILRTSKYLREIDSELHAQSSYLAAYHTVPSSAPLMTKDVYRLCD